MLLLQDKSFLLPFWPLERNEKKWKSYFSELLLALSSQHYDPLNTFVLGLLVIIVQSFLKVFKKLQLVSQLEAELQSSMCQQISLLLFSTVQPHKWTSLTESLLDEASKVLDAAVGLWPNTGDWMNQFLSRHWGPGRHWAPLPSLWNLSSLVTGRPYNAQGFVSDSIVRGRLRGKKGTSPRDRKARWNKKVWLCGLKRAGMDQRTGYWPAAFVHQTAMASFNLSLEVDKVHWDIELHRSCALWAHLSASSPTPPPRTISQVKVDGRGWPVHRPNLSGIHHKGSWALSPDARRPSLTLLYGIHMVLLPPCPGSTGKATAWRESEQRGALSCSPGDGKPQLCGKQRWT